MLLSFGTTLDKAKLIGETPLHDRFGIEGAQLVAPGQPDKSILLHRINRRGRGQMPQLGTTIVDEQAAELMAEWIRSLK